MPKQNNDKRIEIIEKKIEQPVKRAFRFFKIDQERQKKIIEVIKDRARPDLDFIILTIFSTVIVALGLISDNAAVVIGGMIISPLIWPILALALAIIKGSSSQLRKNIFTFIKATVIIFVVAFVIGVFSPYFGDSHEVLLRTRPTLYELFIALAAGFIGTFAVVHPKLSGALAGVVAAVALVPPLAVLGILFAEGNFILATGSALLYFTNFIAITLAAVILFLMAGIKFPKRETTKNLAISNISWVVIFLIVVAIPLTLIMKNVIVENREMSTVQEVIENYTVNSKITHLSIDHQGDISIIVATIQSPVEITSSMVNRLSDILVARLGQSVNLKITVVPTYEADKNVAESNGTAGTKN